MPRLFPFVLAFLLLVGVDPVIAQDSDKKYVDVNLIADKTRVQGGDRLTIGIVQTIAPKWHVYWVNPGDSGEATKVRWQGVEGIQAAALEWPLPKKLPFGPLTNYGYEERVVLLQELTLPETVPAEQFALSADISLLVCEEICIPEQHQASLVLNGDTVAEPQQIAQARAALPLKLAWPAVYSLQGDDIELRVEADESAPLGEVLDSIELYFTEPGLIANHAQPTASLRSGTLVVRQERGEIAAQQIAQSAAVLTYVDPSGRRQGIELSAVYGEAGMTTTEAPSSSLNLLTALLFALAGGVILNLMPCVFPVLSLKAFSLMRMRGESEQQVRWHGLAYVAGVVLSFLLVAAALLVLKAAGNQIGWGFQLQNPAFIYFLCLLIFLIALNLAGFFEIGGAWMSAGSNLSNASGAQGSFFTGVLATLVATPCTAPFMGAAMGFALTQSPWISLTVFAFLGLGLALPYLLLCFVPALRRALPAPGAWMEKLKEFLAFPMLATCAWLVWVLAQQSGSDGVLLVLLSGVGLVFVIWLWRLAQSGWILRVLGAAVLLMAFSPMFFVAPRDAGATDNDSQNWQDFSREKLDLALQSPAPVFVNMTAAWCITCKVNEKVALDTEATRRLFESEGVRYLKGDWTNFNAEITVYLERYGRNGVPIYVVYPAPDPQSGKRPKGKLLPQILSEAIVAEAIISARSL